MSTTPPLPADSSPEAVSTQTIPQIQRSLAMVEAVAFAAISSCIVTNRLLLKKGLITAEEFSTDLEENAKIMAETILPDGDVANFFETIRLLKGATSGQQ